MSTATLKFDVAPITPTLGAVVEGIDLREPLDAETVAQLRQAWLDHGVLLFRNQDLSDKQLENFIGYFGTPITEPSTGSYGADTKRAPVVSGDTGRSGSKVVAEVWHADATWLEQPPVATALRMVTPPPGGGGDTCWSNVTRAYDDLIEPMRYMLDRLQAVHWMAPSLAAMGLAQATNNDVQWVHPVVSVHPETGRKSLFVSEGWTQSIVGLPSSQSVHVLAMLYDHIRSPLYCMRWHWAAGDVALWDNRSLQHFAVPDYDCGRIVQRVVTAGWKPVGPTQG